MRVLIALLLSSTGPLWSSQQTTIGEMTSTLITTLLDNYSAFQMPTNGSMPLRVSILLSVSNVMDVDILRYTMSTVLLLNQSWYDSRLQWSLEQYPRPSIIVPWDAVWTPLFNIREAHLVEYKDPAPRVKLHNTGWVQFFLLMRIDSNCNFELFKYPEDETNCTLTFFSLLDNSHELVFDLSYVNEVENVKHEYLVSNVNASTIFGLGPPSFSLTISMKHTPDKSVLSLIVPSFAILIADGFGFMLPILENDRISYKVTLLLGYLLFHTTLVEKLPGSSSCNPLLIHLFLSILILLFISMIETIIVTRLAAGDLPRWMRRLPRTRSITDHEGTNDNGTGPRDLEARVKESQNPEELEKWHQALAVGLDRYFSIIYITFMVLFCCAFTAVWFLMACRSESRPRPRPGF